MTITMYLIFVLVQIAAFQYGATHVVRLASGLPKDEGNLVPEVRARVAALHRRVLRVELLLGGVLFAGALLVALVLPLALRPQKLLMTVISLTSTSGLIWGYLATYRALYQIAASLPDPGRRVAGLEPRRLSNYYSPWREVLPWGLVAMTAGLTVHFAARSDAASRLSEARVWFRPVTQFALNLALLLLTVVRVRSHTCLALGRKTWMDQREFLELEEQSRRAEARASYWSRVGIVVLTGVMQARVLGIAPWGAIAEFGIVVVMMLFFGRHLQRLARSRRALEEPPGRVSEPAGSNRGAI